MPAILFETSKLTKEQKRVIAKEFTETASKVTGIAKEFFYVFMKENDSENVAVGGTLLSDQNKQSEES